MEVTMKRIKDIKWLSSLAKVFPTDRPEDEYETMIPSFFSNEVFSFQCAYFVEGRENNLVRVIPGGSLQKFVRIRQVCSVPVRFPGRPGCDAHYLSCEPGLYPDLLKDVKQGMVRLYTGQWQALFFTVDLRKVSKADIPFSRQNLTLHFLEEQGEQWHSIGESEFTVEIKEAKLPKQKLYHTEWFHGDCLADYYGVEPLSEEHWEILKNFICHYGASGMNTILVPTFTPPLDTAVGRERTTMQLVDVVCHTGKDGCEYSFGFEKLYRFINLCREAGIEYFEMAHLFTQWGAKAAPKVLAVREGKIQKIFGWENKSESAQYQDFLRQYLTALIDNLNEWGLRDSVFFHLSDEPEEENIETYASLREHLLPYLQGYPILDAVSRYSFYKRGIVDHPVPGIDHIALFIERQVPDLWTYYCSAQEKMVTNRFLAMPSSRNRILGVLLYYFNIRGFLHWGYNFYNSQYSLEHINPYEVTDAGGAFPAGDAFLVYPGENKKPEDSLRMVMLAEAMQDIRALEALESITSREETIALIERCAGGKLTMQEYPLENKFFIMLRQEINRRI